MVLAGARYAKRTDALADFKDVWGAKHEGEFDHTAVAVLTKNEHGELQIERHNSTTKHMGWGGALLGAALVVVAPPVGVAALAAGTATGGALAGAGAWVGHFHHTIPKKDVAEVSELLDSGESGLIVAAVNRKGTDIEHLLSHAVATKIIETKAGDMEAEFEKGIKEAEAIKAASAASA